MKHNCERLGLPHWNAFWHKSGIYHSAIPGAPLHIPPDNVYTTPFDTHYISQLALRTPFAERWSRLLRFVEDGEYVMSIVHRYLERNTYDFNATSSLTVQQELAILSATTFYTTVDPAEFPLGARFLLRGEEDKDRNRLLCWTHLINEALLQCEDYLAITSTICDTLDSTTQVQPNDIATAVDIDKAFFGFQIHPLIQRLSITYLPRLNRYVVPLRLPMGYRPAAELCNLAMLILAFQVSNTDGSSIKVGEEVRTFAHVDNVRFLARSPAVAAEAQELFIRLAARCGMKCSVTDPQIFLGMKWNYTTATVQLTQKSLDRLTEGETVMQHGNDCTFRQYYTFFCRLLNYSRILRYPLATIYQLMKFTRKRLSTLQNADCPTKLWACLQPLLKSWITTLRANNPTRHTHDSVQSDTVMFTDASLSGWGAVIIIGTRVYECQGRWPGIHTPKDIARLEIQAIAQALTHCINTNLHLPPHLLIAVDSTTAANVIHKGHSLAFTCNSALMQVYQCLHALNIQTLAIAYIHTAQNPADELSRFDFSTLQHPRTGGKGGREAAGGIVSPLPPALGRLGESVAAGQRYVRLPETAYTLRATG